MRRVPRIALRDTPVIQTKYSNNNLSQIRWHVNEPIPSPVSLFHRFVAPTNHRLLLVKPQIYRKCLFHLGESAGNDDRSPTRIRLDDSQAMRLGESYDLI